MIFQYWGATNEEIHGSIVGDNLCPDATLIATRSITDTQFEVFGNSGNKSVITTVISVSGLQSGAVTEFEVQITK